MGKFRVRVSAKGKRWRKGQSSSSNPSVTKYRDAAKSGFFHPTIGESMLTQEALTRHDAVTSEQALGDKQDHDEEPDSGSSVGGQTFKTFDTFASDWTQCSNTSFNKLLLNFRSDSAVHKELLAVLAAVSEVIRERGGSETSTEYFASLMTALDGENDDSSVHAVLTLLSMGIKSVPASVLRLKFPQSSRTLMNLLAKYAHSGNVSILRPIIGCLTVLLRAQEKQSWNDPYTIKVLDSLMAFITFSKPKVRKSAQHGVKAVLLDSEICESEVAHVARHCVELLENTSTTNITSALHILALLKDIMHLFPKKQIKSCCEACLKVMTMQNVLVTSCCMQALHGMLSAGPPSGALPPDRNARLITALYEYQPPPADGQATRAWLATLLQAHINLYRNDVGLCLSLVSRFFTTASSLYLCDKPDVLASVTHSLALLVETVFSEPTSASASLDREGEDKRGDATEVAVSGAHLGLAALLSQHLRDLLGYQYHSAWTHVLHLIKTLFKSCCSREYSDAMEPCLLALASLRDSNQFCYNNEAESALGAAVRALGPAPVLKVVPFKVSKTEKPHEFKRSWILPVLKNNVQDSDLKLFVDYFLPQAVFCRNESDRLKSTNDQVASVSYDLLQAQIWSLLPSFSTRPKDIAASFPMIAKALGSVLSNKKDLRQSILACLRKLVTFSLEDGRSADLAVISRFAKNYLPILFSIYSTPSSGTDEEATRLATLETIKVYLKVADKSLVAELFSRAVEKLKEESKEGFVKVAVLDLIKALIQYLNGQQLDIVYSDILGRLAGDLTDHRQQKKYFRLIEELCCCQSADCKQFLSSRLETVKDTILNSLSTSAASSKGARLRCLSHLLDWESLSGGKELVASVLPEVVLCVKDINSSTRETAYGLLVRMADLSEPQHFVTSVMAGLAGSPSTIACCLLALAATVHHYKDKLSKTLDEEIVYNVGLLMVCSTREVVTAALSFLKVYIQTFPRDKIATFVPSLMRLFSKMNEDVKRGCRTKMRDLLARLVRWYGGDTVMGAIPADDTELRTRVRNLAKIHNRRKREKEESRKKTKESQHMDTDRFLVPSRPTTIEDILADSDSEVDLEASACEQRGKRRISNKAYITETPGDIIDFTDLSATKKISASKPAASGTEGGFRADSVKQMKKKRGGDFKTAPDGRLIIADNGDSDDQDTPHKKKSFCIPGLEDSEDDYEASEGEDDERSMVSGAKPNRKRALSVTSSASLPNKYQAGGIGIHRAASRIDGGVKKKSRKGSDKGPRSLSGAEYRAKKARGDIRRKGQPDPFAYLPLRRDNLNKRKKMKAAGQFKNLIRGAKKGAGTGRKQRARAGAVKSR